MSSPVAPWPQAAYNSRETYRYQLAARHTRIAAHRPRKAPAHWAPSPTQGLVAELTRRIALRRLFRAAGFAVLAITVRLTDSGSRS